MNGARKCTLLGAQPLNIPAGGMATGDTVLSKVKFGWGFLTCHCRNILIWPPEKVTKIQIHQHLTSINRFVP